MANIKGNHRLRAFSRIDGSGRIIPQTMVLRLRIPKSGRWVENQTYLCCNPTTTTTTSTTTTTTTTR